MNLEEIIRTIKTNNCKRIIVTGAHRSGTTLAAYVLANELQLPFYKEETIKGGKYHLLQRFDSVVPQYVLQAPGFSDRCHLFDFDAVVFMQRNSEDVKKSMTRLDNNVIQGQIVRTLALLNNENKELSLPALKLKAFKEVQQPVIKNGLILDYESLETHPFFIAKEERTNFDLRQITHIKAL